MEIYLVITVTDKGVEPVVTMSNQSWQGVKSNPVESLDTVRRSGQVLSRVLDFAEAVKS